MKTIIPTLIALALFVGPTFVAGGTVTRPESGGKGHISVKERRQIPALPTVDISGTGPFLGRSSRLLIDLRFSDRSIE
jgi:hypothetical protein